MVNITGAKCPISGAVLMMALSNGTSRYSLNLSQADGARGAAEVAGAATTGAAAGPEAAGPEAAGDAERLEDAILLSIYRDS